MDLANNQRDSLDVADAPWQGVSSRLITIRRITSTAVLVPVAVITAIFVSQWQTWSLWLIPIASLITWATALALTGRQVRAITYACREHDLVIRKGILARRLVVIPYGRMQTVEVSVGPLERRFSLASLQFQTASARTNATIPGLAAADAQVLREELVRLGESRMRRL